jgi:hypothetical protein
VWPSDSSTSAGRSFATICSGLYRLRGIFRPLPRPVRGGLSDRSDRCPLRGADQAGV